MFKVETYKNADLPAGAAIALTNRLWVPGWCLQRDLESYYMRASASGEMAIGFLNGKPVCVAVHNNYQIMAFCRKALRGNGYASKCIAALDTKNVSAQEGIKGSLAFWHKHKIFTHS